MKLCTGIIRNIGNNIRVRDGYSRRPLVAIRRHGRKYNMDAGLRFPVETPLSQYIEDILRPDP
jgi:hypothetical protein